MKRNKKGELVYIPSEVKLVRFGKDGEVYRWTKTEKPINCLVVGEHKERWCNVLYKGEHWSVQRDSVYEAKENSDAGDTY